MSIDGANIPAIDMRSIAQIAEGDGLGGEFIAEIIDVFLGDLNERLRVIETQTRQSDDAGIAATAHAIKGSCGHFGAARLVELSADVEDRVKTKQTDHLQRAVDLMVAEAERVRSALQDYRAQSAPN